MKRWSCYAQVCLLVLLVSCPWHLGCTGEAGTTYREFALGMVPLRLLFKRPSMPMYDDDARKVENAVRLVYGLVECRGDGANQALERLTTLANRNRDNVSRVRERLYTIEDGQPTLNQQCRLYGSTLLGAGTFANLFAHPPQSQAELEAQQMVWMAIRQQPASGAVQYTNAFLQFLSENLDAAPASDSTASAAILEMEQRYNPCRSRSYKGLDKTHLFSCNTDQGIQARRPPRSLKNVLASLLAHKSGAFFTVLSQMNAGTQADGWEQAATVQASVATLSLSQRLPPKNLRVLVGSNTGMLPLLDEMELAPVIQAIAPQVQILDRLFGIKVGQQPAPVLSIKNPRRLPIPPAALGTEQMAFAADTAAGSVHALQQADGSWIVPSPALNSDGSIAPRWHRWKYDEGLGWRFVAHRGMPYFTASSSQGVFSALVAFRQARSSTSTGSSNDGQLHAYVSPPLPPWQEDLSVPTYGVTIDGFFKSDEKGVNEWLKWTRVGTEDDTEYNTDDYNCQGFADAAAKSGLLSGAVTDARLVGVDTFDKDGNLTELSHEDGTVEVSGGHAIVELQDANGTCVLYDPQTGEPSPTYERNLDGSIPQEIQDGYVTKLMHDHYSDDATKEIKSATANDIRDVDDPWQAQYRVTDQSAGLNTDLDVLDKIQEDADLFGDSASTGESQGGFCSFSSSSSCGNSSDPSSASASAESDQADGNDWATWEYEQDEGWKEENSAGQQEDTWEASQEDWDNQSQDTGDQGYESGDIGSGAYDDGANDGYINDDDNYTDDSDSYDDYSDDGYSNNDYSYEDDSQGYDDYSNDNDDYSYDTDDSSYDDYSYDTDDSSYDDYSYDTDDYSYDDYSYDDGSYGDDGMVDYSSRSGASRTNQEQTITGGCSLAPSPAPADVFMFLVVGVLVLRRSRRKRAR